MRRTGNKKIPDPMISIIVHTRAVKKFVIGLPLIKISDTPSTAIRIITSPPRLVSIFPVI